MRHCSKCNKDKAEVTFVRRTERPWLFLAWCRTCRAVARQTHKDTYPDQYKESLELRNTTRRKVCGWCWGKTGNLQLVIINNRTGYYHFKCAEEKAMSTESDIILYQ